MEWSILDDGNIEVIWSAQARKKFLAEHNDSLELANLAECDWLDSDEALLIALEPLVCNGLTLFSPAEIGAPRNAVILGEIGYNDVLACVTCYHTWWYPDSSIRSPLKELMEHGRLVFVLAELSEIICSEA